ncbi:MAG: hypothetical protein AVDCRST_MAG13-609, partial [uncultured Solirubrobacteraceae bacterium]
ARRRGRAARGRDDGRGAPRGHRRPRRGAVDGQRPRPPAPPPRAGRDVGARAPRPPRGRPRGPVVPGGRGPGIPAAGLRVGTRGPRRLRAPAARGPRRVRRLPARGRHVAAARPRARGGDLPQRLRAPQPRLPGRPARRRHRLRHVLARPARVGPGPPGLPARAADRPGPSRDAAGIPRGARRAPARAVRRLRGRRARARLLAARGARHGGRARGGARGVHGRPCGGHGLGRARRPRRALPRRRRAPAGRCREDRRI